MIRLIAARLIGAIVVLFVVATSGFFILRNADGGPFQSEKVLPPEIEANIRKEYKLDQPLWQQYTSYLHGLAKFDLGHSMKRNSTVNDIISENFPRSLQLGLLALGFASLGGIFLGVVAAARQNKWPDHAAMIFALLGISISSIVLGPLLQQWFALRLGWLPPVRWDGFKSMILPAATLGLIYMGVISRLTRAGMLETIRQDYIRTARAKGLPERTVIWKHAFRLGILPVVTFLGPATAQIVTGSFVVEKIFQIPGLGFYFISSISDRDYTTLTGVMVFYSAVMLFLNFVVDVAYGFIDPRIREARA